MSDFEQFVRKCAYCSNSFSVTGLRQSSKRFCSPACRYAAARAKNVQTAAAESSQANLSLLEYASALERELDSLREHDEKMTAAAREAADAAKAFATVLDYLIRCPQWEQFAKQAGQINACVSDDRWIMRLPQWSARPADETVAAYEEYLQLKAAHDAQLKVISRQIDMALADGDRETAKKLGDIHTEKGFAFIRENQEFLDKHPRVRQGLDTEARYEEYCFENDKPVPEAGWYFKGRQQSEI